MLRLIGTPEAIEPCMQACRTRRRQTSSIDLNKSETWTALNEKRPRCWRSMRQKISSGGYFS